MRYLRLKFFCDILASKLFEKVKKKKISELSLTQKYHQIPIDARKRFANVRKQFCCGSLNRPFMFYQTHVNRSAYSIKKLAKWKNLKNEKS
ncbi:hypothetical protein PGB90_004936 [Kerria lacca]